MSEIKERRVKLVLCWISFAPPTHHQKSRAAAYTYNIAVKGLATDRTDGVQISSGAISLSCQLAHPCVL
jgi:hypothetical protein